MAHTTVRHLRHITAAIALSLAATTGLNIIPTAIGAPSNETDLIARLESQIAHNRAKAEEAELTYAQSAEQFAQANDELSAASTAAKQASEKASLAQKEADKAKAKLGQLAVAMYRADNREISGIEALTQSDTFRNHALHQEVVDILGAQADNQVQGLSALQNIAQVLQKDANRALAEKKAAAKKLTITEKQARNEAEKALEFLNNAKAERDKIVVKLAKVRGVTVEQERLHQEKVESQRAATAENAAIKRQQAAAAQAAAKHAQEIKDAEARAKREAEAAAVAKAKAKIAAQQQAAQAAAQEAARQAVAQAKAAEEAKKKAEIITQTPKAPAGQGYSSSLLSWAKTRIGTPYIWGGTGPEGYDCSGLIYAGMKELGKGIQRSAASQYSSLANVTFEQRQPGDLIFFSNNGETSGVYHVGIYAGNDQILHAPQPGKTVSISPFYNRHKMMPLVARL